MNFGHFSTQNTSVKVEISNQVKCHTAQRSEARGGRAGPEAGRRRSGALRPHSSRARGSWRGIPWGGAGGCAPLPRTPALSPIGRGPGKVGKPCHQQVQPRAPSVGRPPALAGRGVPRGRETLPSSPARKGPAVLSCLVAPPRDSL